MKALLATDGSQYFACAAQFLTRIKWSQDDTIPVFHVILAVEFRNDVKFSIIALSDPARLYNTERRMK